MKLKHSLGTLLCSALFVWALAGQLSCSSNPKIRDRSGPGVYHEVKKGQTLYRIALTYGVPQDRIVRANGISDPSRIETGSRLFIPGVSRTLEVPIYKPSAAVYTFLPANGLITSRFGPRSRGRWHTGVDIAGKRNQEIRAVMDGTVTFAGRKNGYGLTVIIDHGNGYETLYAHNSKNLVRRGQKVAVGQAVALMGKSGNASGYHVHFELRENGRPIDPLLHLDR